MVMQRKCREEMFTFAKETFGLERNNHTMKGYDILIHDLEQKQSLDKPLPVK